MPRNCTSLGSRTRSQLSLRSVLLPSAEVSTGHPNPCVGRVTERDTVWRVPIPRHTGQRGRGHRLCAPLCALFFAFVLLVDDAENLVLFLASDAEAFKGFSRPAVRADRAAVHTGGPDFATCSTNISTKKIKNLRKIWDFLLTNLF